MSSYVIILHCKLAITIVNIGIDNYKNGDIEIPTNHD